MAARKYRTLPYLTSSFPHMCYLYSFEHFLLNTYYVPGTLVGAEDTEQSWEKMCTVGSYVSVQTVSRTPLSIRKKEE